MNANELADELENTYPFVGVMEVAAIMLRQQQAEIAALKKRPAINKADGLVCAKCYERIGE